MMMTKRLDRLEMDLKVLNSMQDLFLHCELDEEDSEAAFFPGHELVLLNHLAINGPDDVPERDVKRSIRRSKQLVSKSYESISKTKSQNKTNRENHQEGQDRKNEASKINQNQTQMTDENQAVNDEGHSTAVKLTDVENAAVKITEELEKERNTLKEDIERERSLRAEVEESAKHVYIKLQKVEDELEREKKTKESLLLGTLQLKNLVHGYDSKVKESNVDLAASKAEIQRLSSEVQNLSKDNAKIVKRLKHFCNYLGYKKERTQGEFESDTEGNDDRKAGKDDSTAYVDFLKRKIEELTKKFTDEESDKVGKLTAELAQALGRSDKFEKESQETSTALQKCMSREENLKHQLHMSQVSLSTVESELLKKQVEFECTLQKYRSDSQIEKERAAVKYSECMSVIRRTKELLLTLRNERDKCRKNLHEAGVQNQGLTNRLKRLETEKHNMMVEVQRTTQQIDELSREKMELEVKSRTGNFKLEESLQKAVWGRRKCMELLTEMKHQLVNAKSKYQHEAGMLVAEKDKLLTENKRLDENFRVLQKVSEDQGQTINKLRGDLESVKSINFKLESKLRDYECTENQLISKLGQCEKKIENYTKHIEHLEDKIEKYEDDVKTHDCEDFVDSRYKRKLNEIEESFRRRNKEWEETLSEIESERDKALQTAKKTMEKVDELRQHQTSQLTQVKAQFQSEMKKLSEQQNHQNTANHNKIHELQSELDRTKLSSSQIQRALSTKIQQLQAALNICIGGSTQNNNSSLGLLHQLHHHQQHHPVAAFSNVGSVNNNAACPNNNGASSTTANLPFNFVLPGSGSGGAQSHQTQPTCFGNSTNVNDCTSGILTGEPYSSTGRFDVGFIDNLIL